MTSESIDGPIVTKSVKTQLKLLTKGEASCTELIQKTFEQIDTVNPVYNAIVTEVDREHVLTQAQKIDKERSLGNDVGSLGGIPFTIKDSIATSTIRTTSGAIEHKNMFPSQSALVVERLKLEGAILIGKTNLPRFSLDLVTKNDLFGTTNNPWDIERSSGGSSGGSAVAVVTGMSSFDLGSDIGGSLRNPAHCCGAVAHKPTTGIVPLRGIIGSDSYLDNVMNVLGPIARSPTDLSLILDVISGPDTPQSKAWKLSLPKTKNLHYRVAPWIDDPYCKVSSEVHHVLSTAINSMSSNERLDLVQDRPTLSFENSDRVFKQLLDAVNLPRFLQETRTTIPRAKNMTFMEWVDLQSKKENVMETWKNFFINIDVLLCPVLPTIAPLHTDAEKEFRYRTISVDHKERSFSDLLSWPGLASLAGLPSTAVYIGLTASGLPVGIQVIGSWYEDHKCIDVASIIHKLLNPPTWKLKP